MCVCDTVCTVKRCNLLNLLGIFVADKDNNWINVNTVEPFDGVRGDVEQTVAALDEIKTTKDKNKKTTSTDGLI